MILPHYTIEKMKRIERIPHTAIVLKPTTQFLNWSLPFHDPHAPVQPLEADLFLIPDWSDEIEVYHWLSDHFTELFVHFLSEWTDIENFWPDVDDHEVFNDFFEVTIIPMAWRVNEG